MKSLRNPLLLTLLLGGAIGYIAACNNAKPTADATAAPAQEPAQEAAAIDATAPSPDAAPDAPAKEPVQVAQAPADAAAPANPAATDPPAADTKPAAESWQRQVFFGEQHLHTTISLDAYIMGNHKNTPTDAFNYNKGKPVKKYLTGETLQRQTPYDWCAVTDHAEYMGIFTTLAEPNSPLADDPVVKGLQSGDKDKIDAAFKVIANSVAKNSPYAPFMNAAVRRSVWEKQRKMINDAYEPGKFTTLIAYEWTSMPNNQNLHRNVFFRDDGPEVPFTSLDSNRPEDLWTYLDVQRSAGHECFAIPHNGNISNGLMFAPFDSDGDALTTLYAERRARNEPLTEIVQVKSASETHPALSPNDEFADFELHYKGLIGTNPAVTSRIDYGFIRQALINGLGHEERLGINPFKYGVVSGADSHTAFSINEEFNFTGPHGVSDATPKARLSGGAVSTGAPAIDLASAGVTGVWADENTRAGIFDGLKRKETYGTSGTFIRLRFFGGWDYPADLVEGNDFAKKAYAGGVPMGGDLRAMPAAAKAPTFAVWAMKDPKGATLDRIQIVKGWRHLGHGLEKVYDVAWSGDRKVDPKTGKLPPVGNTVNVKEATYENTIGETQFRAVWTDPDFDPSERAVYYVRVIEIPTPRWSTYDAKTLGVAPPAGFPATIQERAWSSPIWYTPDPSLPMKDPAPHVHQAVEGTKVPEASN